MSALVLAICVICYFIANIYQNKFSSTMGEKMYAMNFFQTVWMSMAVLAFLVMELLGDGLTFSPLTMKLAPIAGIFTILGGMCLLYALSKGPLSLTILIFSMYVVVPPILAMPILGESFSICQWLGLVLIIIVIFLSNFDRDTLGKKYPRIWWLLCIGSIIFVGLSNFVMKYHQTLIQGREQREYGIVSYLTGVLLAGCIGLVLKKKILANKNCEPYKYTKEGFLFPAICVALAQGGANLCNLYNASRLPSIVLYPVSQLSTLMLTVIYGIIVLKEKPTKVSISCLLLGTIAILLMNF